MKSHDAGNKKKQFRVSIQDPSEATPLVPPAAAAAFAQAGGIAEDDDSTSDHDYPLGEVMFETMKDSERRESIAADKLSMRLLEIDDDDSETEEIILQEALSMDIPTAPSPRRSRMSGRASTRRLSGWDATLGDDMASAMEEATRKAASERLCTIVGISLLALGSIGAALYLGVQFIGPPNIPVGPYELVERQEGAEFFKFYNFYEGPDSAGSNGYINYVSQATALSLGIANVTFEVDELDLFQNSEYPDRASAVAAATAVNKEDKEEEAAAAEEEKITSTSSTPVTQTDPLSGGTPNDKKAEPFLYIKSSPTPAGPRNSIRLEGKQRFNRGLFIIDVRHMPAGCGVWPAFWLTDEANWPVNGEIDIVEGVNYQSEAKTAMHSTKGCRMDDVPMGVKTGGWDTAVGIPDKKTGIPDMTFREARDCFVYNPHQWLNQGCVAVDEGGDSLGIPLNEKGGGVFALEWDPANFHIRTWVFTPHTEIPENLVDAIRTAGEPVIENRVMPDPTEWPLPYGYFPVGDQTQCPAAHFRNMRLVLNTAFCGSVAGNRFFVDCKNQSKSFKSCNAYIKSQPKELDDAYWKIRGVYVYQREWRQAWLK